MNRILKAFLITVIALVLCLAAAPAFANQPEKTDFLIGFHFRPGVSEANLVQSAGGTVKATFSIIPVIVASLPPQAIDALKDNPNISFIEPDRQVQLVEQTVPWGVERVFGSENYPFAAWNNSKGGGITVAVLDTGIDSSHEDLIVAGGTNTIDATHWGSDIRGHGTHVAGIVAAVDNEIGVAGIAPLAELYSVKVLNDSGNGTTSSVIAGIEWAVANNISVINMSLGSTVSSTAEQNACNAAYASGHLLIAAAGNEGNTPGTGNNVIFPAGYSSVIAVAASTITDSRASFSSTGPAVELIAPGNNILSTIPGSLYENKSGTSMAAPHAAGVAALAWAAKPDLTNVQIRAILQQTAQNLGISAWHQGYGLVRADLAITAALETEPPPPGYTFNPPSPVNLGLMIPGEYSSGYSLDGWLTGGNPAGYTVTGHDANSTVTAGHMRLESTALEGKLLAGPDADSLGSVDILQIFLDTDSETDSAVELYVSQFISLADVAGEGYSLVITFTVTEK